MSFNWNKIVKEMRIYTKDDYQQIIIKPKKIKWQIVEQYPSCQLVDLLDLYDMSKIAVKQVYFNFEVVENMGVTILMEDRNRATSRTIKDNVLMYSGPTLEQSDLKTPFYHTLSLSISQTINEELDLHKNCTNYPNEYFSSFKECDKMYVHQNVLRYGVMPFWATSNFSEITTLRFYIQQTSIV